MINENKIRILYQVTGLILNAFFFFVTTIHLKNIPEHHFIWEIVILIVLILVAGGIMAYKIIKKACNTINPDITVGTHTLRRTFGYHYFKQFKNISSVTFVL